MQFILSGFTQDLGCRVFAFARVGLDTTRAEFTVRADLSLTRTHGIPMQELPLLCRALLERQEASDDNRALIYTEAEMRVYAQDRAARLAATQKKRPPRKPAAENLGAAWRGPQQPH
jgi:hypothetical protein